MTQKSGREAEKGTRLESENSRSMIRNSTNIPTGADKTTVYIRCGVTYLGDIDVTKQQFTCELWMTATWKEPRLEGKKNEEVNWDNEWNPKITFSNALSMDRVYKGQRLFQEEGSDVPLAQEIYKIKGTFKEHFDLREFPMDCQELSVILSSDWSDKAVVFHKDMKKRDSIRQQSFSAPHDWSLCSHVHTDSTSLAGEGLGSGDRSYPMYIITSHVWRKASYYFWNATFVMFVITALSLASFAVSPSLPADRLGVTLTLLLTGVAFNFVISRTLPTISYMTLLDKYILIHILFMCLVAILNTVAVTVRRSSQATYDMVSLFTGIGVLLVIQVVAVFIAIHKHQVISGELNKFTRGYKQRNEEIERQRRERDWYAERSKQPKTPSVTLTPAGSRPPGKHFVNGYSVERKDGSPNKANKSTGSPNKSYV